MTRLGSGNARSRRHRTPCGRCSTSPYAPPHTCVAAFLSLPIEAPGSGVYACDSLWRCVIILIDARASPKRVNARACLLLRCQVWLGPPGTWVWHANAEMCRRKPAVQSLRINALQASLLELGLRCRRGGVGHAYRYVTYMKGRCLLPVPVHLRLREHTHALSYACYMALALKCNYTVVVRLTTHNRDGWLCSRAVLRARNSSIAQVGIPVTRAPTL